MPRCIQEELLAVPLQKQKEICVYYLLYMWTTKSII